MPNRSQIWYGNSGRAGKEENERPLSSPLEDKMTPRDWIVDQLVRGDRRRRQKMLR